MIKFKPLLLVVCTLGLSLILSTAAFGQTVLPPKPPTVLNFVKVSDPVNAGFTVTNPTSNYADVTFTFYGIDGNPVSSGLNPVRHRVAPKGQISMRASEIFAPAAGVDGWVQVTSATPGLAGFYLLGDFATKLTGSESAAPLTAQVVPYIRNDQNRTNTTELVIVNPDSANAAVTITLYNANGDEKSALPSRSIPGHGALRVPATALSAAGAGIFSASISASVPVTATAIVSRGDSLLFVPGQAVDQNRAASVRVAPDFLAANGFDSSLILTNPSGSPVSVNVTLFSQNGSSISSQIFAIPAYGSISARTTDITGQPTTPLVDGWLRVDSPSVVLAGLVILDEGRTVTAVPLQTAPLNGMTYSQISETPAVFTSLAIVNPSAVAASVDVILIHPDGTTFARTSVTIPANSKSTKTLREVLPDAWDPANGFPAGYFFLGSQTPIYGVAILRHVAGTFLASMPPSGMAPGFSPDQINVLPRIVSVEPGTAIQPGLTPSLRVYVENLNGNATFVLGGQSQASGPVAPGIPQYIDVPLSLEPGFVNLTVRSADTGLESVPFVLTVMAPDNAAVQTLSGQAYYQKIDVTNAGLDLTHPVMVPVRNARVEVVNRISGAVVEVAQTDLRGRFNVPVPSDPNLTVRVVSRLRTGDLRVQDNTNLNGYSYYVITADIDGRSPPSNLLLAEGTRVSGAFNILEMVQRANDVVKMADPVHFTPLPVAIFWSTRNTKRSGNPAQGLVGTSFFNLANNTAYILGDRAVDSDEFDDSVIVHEYAHMLAAKYSRDDSPGGESHIGEALDPRLAWSEGWANFFSSAVRNDSIWRDSSGPNGVNVFQFDLADNLPAGDTTGGYWDEGAVGSLLWNLSVEPYPFSQVWPAFTLLKKESFVYLPYFLDHFLDLNPAAVEAVVTMAQKRYIDLQLSVPPSVSNPFPLSMNVGTTVFGSLDSLTPRRTNLMTSSHFYTFTTAGGAASIRMDITGPGPGNNLNNDLDLFLMDANGRVIARSDGGGNGAPERIIIPKLPGATYVVEIRSFYTKAETGGVVLNSGSYKLSVAVQ